MILSIQYLRALAAIAVVLVHTLNNGSWGEIGVDIFFIISGYIMLYLLDTKHRNAKQFFLARYLRIAPMYYIATTVFVLLGFSQNDEILNIIKSILFISFKPALYLGWTLDYEFFFYAMVALTLVFTNKLKYSVFAISLFLFSSSFIIDFIIFPEKAYGHFIEFWYGIAIYLLIKFKSDKPRIGKITIISFICIGFVLSYFSLFLHDSEGKTYLRFLSYGIPAFIIVYFSVLFEKRFELGENKILLLIGNASYSIYLTHPITIGIYKNLFSNEIHSRILDYAITFLSSIVIGITIYLLLEKKIINYIHKEILSKHI